MANVVNNRDQAIDVFKHEFPEFVNEDLVAHRVLVFFVFQSWKIYRGRNQGKQLVSYGPAIGNVKPNGDAFKLI